jgi:tetratricopeptide (TPR) repeat protein
MFRFAFVLLLLVAPMTSSQTPAAPQDPTAVLVRAETLYFEAQFKDALDLLTPLDVQLQRQPERRRERVAVKLRLALCHIGLNQIAEAKARFAELDELDPEYSLDASQFAPKVLALFQETRTERSATRCVSICEAAAKDLQNGKVDDVMARAVAKPTCACMTPVVQSASEVVFKQAVDAYKADNVGEATKKFRSVLASNPQHPMATQYMELIKGKTDLAMDRLQLDWKASFDAHDYPRASTSYRQLLPFSSEEKAKSLLAEMRTSYRDALTTLEESWNRACSVGDVNLTKSLRAQAVDILPEASIAQDVLDKMAGDCALQGCVQMTAQLALVRLRTRVNPDVPDFTRVPRPVNVRVQVKIDENGDVTVKNVQGGPQNWHPAIKSAVEKWKFLPAIVADQPRCVETEIPISIT